MLQEYREILAILPAAREAENRPVRARSVRVVDYRPTPDLDGYYLGVPGALTVFLARRGSWILDAVAAAAVSQDGEDSRLYAQLARYFDGRQTMPLEDAVALVVQQPTYASVRYQGKTLATSLFLPEDIPVIALNLPYNGGDIDLGAFTLIEHYREDSEIEFDAVVLRHMPELNEAERDAMKLVPPDQDELHVGGIGMCFALCGVAVAALVCLATGLCCNRGAWTKPGPRPGPLPGPTPGPIPGPIPGPTPGPLPDPFPDPPDGPGQFPPKPGPKPGPKGFSAEEIFAMGPSRTAREILKRHRDWIESQARD
jgi:hypothetical protein